MNDSLIKSKKKNIYLSLFILIIKKNHLKI